MHSHDLIFHEELFADPAGWTQVYADSHLTQRCRTEPGGTMYTESRIVIHAALDVVMRKLQGEWTWWHGGRYLNRLEKPDGTVHYDHYPFGHNVHVHSIMYPPLPLEGGGWRIRVDISDYMTGTTYYDVLPRADGSTEICSRFSGCVVTGPNRFLPFPGYITERLHLAAERGRWLYPRGTGFPGLIEELEGRAA